MCASSVQQTGWGQGRSDLARPLVPPDFPNQMIVTENLPLLRKTILLLLALVSVNAVAQEWLCIADMFAGFTFEKGRWKAASGSHRQKYVLGMATENEIRTAQLLKKKPPVWVVRKFGENHGISCGDFNEQDMLLCHDVQEFSFNRQTGRFLYTYPIGYSGVSSNEIGTKKENADTPRMMIGKCHPTASITAAREGSGHRTDGVGQRPQRIVTVCRCFAQCGGARHDALQVDG